MFSLVMTLCDAGTCWKTSGYYSENGLRPKLRGSAVFHTSLCLLESALEPAPAPWILTPCLLFRMGLKAVETIRRWLPGNAGISGLPRWTGQAERDAGFCVPGVRPPWVHTLAGTFAFSVAFTGRHRNRKGKVAWRCHDLRFALSEGCLGCLPGNDEIGFMLSLKSNQPVLFTEQLVGNRLMPFTEIMCQNKKWCPLKKAALKWIRMK